MRSLSHTLVAVAFTVGLALAQSVKTPAFDAASLKLDNAPLDLRSGFGPKGGPGTDDPGRFTYNKAYLQNLVTKAWDVEGYQLAGPSWLKPGPDQLYTLTATMPPDTTKEQFHLMFQNLLIERFHMSIHRETRTLSGYELVVAPGGPKLKETTQDLNAPPGHITGGVTAEGFPVLPPGRAAMSAVSKDGYHFKAQAYSVGEFLSFLQGFIYGTVEPGFVGPLADKTGLTGRYDFTLRFGGRSGPAPTVGRNVAPPAESNSTTADDPDGSPGLFSALEKQLGLKLVRVRKVPVKMLVIDYMDKVPAPN